MERDSEIGHVFVHVWLANDGFLAVLMTISSIIFH